MRKIEGGEHDSLRIRVFQALEDEILSGDLKPGDTLKEMKISSELGVSRTPVREAISQLEQEGLVTIHPNRGAVVVGLSLKDVEDIYTIRTHIEGLAAKWAAREMKQEEIEKLKDIFELQEFYYHKGAMEQVWIMDGQFHDLIHQCSRSKPLKQILNSLHHYVARARRLSIDNPNRAASSVEEHHEILKAIQDHDAERAESAMIVHILNAKDSFTEMLDKTNKE